MLESRCGGQGVIRDRGWTCLNLHLSPNSSIARPGSTFSFKVKIKSDHSSLFKVTNVPNGLLKHLKGNNHTECLHG